MQTFCHIFDGLRKVILGTDWKILKFFASYVVGAFLRISCDPYQVPSYFSGRTRENYAKGAWIEGLPICQKKGGK
jgi:hypothetical protein